MNFKLIILSLFFYTLPSHALDVTIRGLNVSSEKGVFRCLLFAGETGFPETPAESLQSVNGPVTNQEGRCTFRNVKPGTYAGSTFHDANSNGRLDKNVLGIPKERYGFSRNASRPFGPPLFEEAAFDLRTNETFILNLK
jgi:uncharacterized protein (DUF2141 family)